jgi:hypothetical protein
MAILVSSVNTYIVIARTVGLTRSPPGVMIAEKATMPRMMIRRFWASHCELTIPTSYSP